MKQIVSSIEGFRGYKDSVTGKLTPVRMGHIGMPMTTVVWETYVTLETHSLNASNKKKK